ncbi:uncharacterized protein LOC135120968 [Zophobas morio]|uniref:uncharacterized protein LOC135120968 n=1 Tax=Zophobas morio TaxID=2755281 RepID=UPI003082D57D
MVSTPSFFINQLVYPKVRTIDSINDCLTLQRDLLNIAERCNANGLELNLRKCKIVSYSRKKKRADSVKDLGVQFDKCLTFIDHIETITQSSFKTLGFIVRTCACFNNADAIKTLFQAFIRTKLEYCSLIWSTNYANQSISLEKVQRRCLKYYYHI